MIPNNVTSGGHWCKKCPKEKSKAAKANFLRIIGEKGGKLIGKYINGKTSVEVECSTGHKWSPRPSHITQGSWCPQCKQSKGEILLEWLASKSELKSEAQIALPEYPLCDYDRVIYHKEKIFHEFDGEQHFDPDTYYNTKKNFEKSRQRDIEKTKLVIEKYRYRMIRMSYDVLKFKRDDIFIIWSQAIKKKFPLLYITVSHSKLCLSGDAEMYSWLTPYIIFPKIKHIVIITENDYLYLLLKDKIDRDMIDIIIKFSNV